MSRNLTSTSTKRGAASWRLLAPLVLFAATASTVTPATAQLTPNQRLDAMYLSVDDTHAYGTQMVGKLQALLRIVGDDDQASELVAASTEIYSASFGQTFQLGVSGLGAVAEYFPVTGTTTGGVSAIENLQTLPVEWAWVSDDPLPAGIVELSLYSGNFLDGPAHVGIACLFDMWAMGYWPSPTEPFRFSVAFIPLDTLSADEPVEASEVLEFMQLACAGEFRTPGSLVTWLQSQLDPPIYVGGDTVLGGDCDVGSLQICMAQAHANLIDCLNGLAGPQAAIDAKVAELEAEIAKQAEGYVDAACQGGTGGLLGGATSGSLPEALLAAAFGAAGGLIAYAMTHPDVGELWQELEDLRADFQDKLCHCIAEMLDYLYSCFLNFCPDLWPSVGPQLWFDYQHRWGC